ncbi:MAG: Tol-Pal system protein TolB, partial [Nitrosomonas sp.]
GSFTAWRTANIRYVIIPRVEANHLSIRLISLNNEVVKEISEVALSGDLNEDRRRLHHVADSIHFELFGVQGIASTRILYTKRIGNSKGDMISEIWEADYDGGGARQITHDVGYAVTPTYVPPAPGMATRQFLYVTYRWGQPKLIYASLKDGEGQRFSLLKGNQLLPAVSKQRDKVAFISDVTGNPDLFIQSFSPEQGPIGKAQQVFSAPGAVQGSPSFNPDGTRLAFVSNKAGQAQIFTMIIPASGARLKDLRPTLISTRARNGTAPAWSPDGSKIAFTALTDGVRQIWMYDFNNGQEYQLTSGTGNKENPSWAPDSLHLVYNTSDPGAAELYLLDLRRLKPIKINLGPGEKRFPSWEPRAAANIHP